MKRIVILAVIFILLTAVRAFFDRGWFRETLEDPASLALWLIVASLISFILYCLYLGFHLVWPMLKVTYNIRPVEETAIIIAGLGILAAFIISGYASSLVTFGASLVMSVLALFGFFWLYRMTVNIYHRIVRGDEEYHFSNWEYFTLLLVSAVVSVAMTCLERDLFTGNRTYITVLAGFLLFICTAICFYWLYRMTKSYIRSVKYRERHFEFTGTHFICNSLTRTTRLSWPSITSIEEKEMPYRYCIPGGSETDGKKISLLITSSERRTPFIIPEPDEALVSRIKKEAASHKQAGTGQ